MQTITVRIDIGSKRDANTVRQACIGGQKHKALLLQAGKAVDLPVPITVGDLEVVGPEGGAAEVQPAIEPLQAFLVTWPDRRRVELALDQAAMQSACGGVLFGE